MWLYKDELFATNNILQVTTIRRAHLKHVRFLLYAYRPLAYYGNKAASLPTFVDDICRWTQRQILVALVQHLKVPDQC